MYKYTTNISKTSETYFKENNFGFSNLSIILNLLFSKIKIQLMIHELQKLKYLLIFIIIFLFLKTQEDCKQNTENKLKYKSSKIY